MECRIELVEGRGGCVYWFGGDNLECRYVWLENGLGRGCQNGRFFG